MIVRAQVSLQPAESKKLIAKAMTKMNPVRTALECGTVVMHPSSSTYFLIEEITGKKPTNKVWVCGIITPYGTCVEIASTRDSLISTQDRASSISNPKAFTFSLVVRGYEVTTGSPLGSLIEEMGPGDVYIKGVNALDPEGRVGVLVGNPVEGGTIAQVMYAAKKRGFSVVFPVGLEKLIPISVKEAAKVAQKKSYIYSMGMDVALWPCDSGIIVTELDAIKILSGATAVPIACGGLGGAEGSVTMVIKGEEKQVIDALNFVKQCKGAKLPDLHVSQCRECKFASTGVCRFPLNLE